MSVSQARVLWFGRYWRERLKEPESLFLHDRLIPVLVTLQAELGTKAFDGANSVEFRALLVRVLRKALPSPPAPPAAFLFEVLSAKAPQEVLALQAALHATPVDPAVVRAPLSALVGALETQTALLLDAIETELTAPDGPDSRGRLSAATDALQRRLLQLDAPATMLKWADAVLADVGLAEALRHGAASLAADPSRLPALWAQVQSAARALTDRQTSIDASSSVLSELRGLQYPTVHTLSQHLERWAAEAPAEENAETVEDVASIRKLGVQTLVSWTERGLDSTLLALSYVRDSSDQHALAYAGAVQTAASMLLAWVRTLPAVDDPLDPEPRSDLGPALHAAAERLIRDAIRDAAIANFRSELTLELTEEIGRCFISAAQVEATDGGVDWPHCSPRSRALIARRTAARRDLHIRLTAALTAQQILLRAKLLAACHTLADSETSHRWGISEIDAWIQLSARIGEYGHRAERATQLLVWENMPGALRMALERIATPLTASSAYDVVLTVHGVEPQGATWSTGPIHWYGADRYQLGEQVWDREGGDATRTLRAWVTVDSPTATSARMHASALVDTALNAATFLLSVDQAATGLRASVGRFALVGLASQGGAQSWGGRNKQELFDVGTANDGHFKAITMDASPLISRMLRPASLSPLDERIIRAYAWYREGRWDPNPVTRFLTYYVALEHIFLAGRIGVKGKLPSAVADLATSWAWVHTAEELVLSRQVQDAEAIRAHAASGTVLEAALNAGQHATTWRADIRPLLVASEVAKLANALSADAAGGDPSAIALQSYHQRFLQFVANHADFDRLRAQTRERWQFTVQLLMRRRNRIVHEAMVSGPDALFYTDELERVLSAVLKHLGTVGKLPHVTTADEAVAWHKTPWLE